MPGYDCIVLWDTGEGTPKYSTEDYQHVVTSIAGNTEDVQKIYNSIRNQGEFFTALMDKLGILQKNEGLQKVHTKLNDIASHKAPALSDIEEAFERKIKKINITVNAPDVKIPELKAPDVVIPPFPEVKLPEITIPDYTAQINELKTVLSDLKGELMKVPKTQKEYSGNFDAVISALGGLEQKFIKTLGDKSSSITADIRSLKDIFSRFDAMTGRILSVQEKLSALDTNDKEILKVKKEVLDDIKRLNAYVNQMTISMLSKDGTMNGLMMSFGHKGVKNG
jgi:predicted  nucleic acid-binding Zn-ribbon protein